MRLNDRKFNELRKIDFELNYTMHAEGSVLVSFGNTKVLCNATVEEKVPVWLRKQNKGWLTAEYSLLPRSTNTRVVREVNKGKQSGRTMEIQRLIGRSLRSVVNLEKLGERTIIIDCDVIQADGGTRTAAITGGFLALRLAVNKLLERKLIKEDPIIAHLAAISVGVVDKKMLLDLDYIEDSSASVDANIVMNEFGEFIEVGSTGEEATFTKQQFYDMIDIAEKGIVELISKQKNMLK